MILYLIAFLTGIFVKIVDTAEDEKLKTFKEINYFFATIYGVLIGFVIANYPNVAPLWIGAILGVALTGKVDAPSHKLGVLVALITTIAWTSNDLNYFLGLNYGLLLLFSAASFADEKIDILLHKIKKKNLFQNLLETRLTLEMVALIVSFLTGTWEIFFAILSFDIGYLGSELTFRKINF
ncbi:hypothetical protein ISS07_05375 [Candidatus Woesearchaeota archaeon]|nr:hypothetical protein [Candidatus Woesearchaeota archaeon]